MSFHPKQETIEKYEAAARGDLEVHVWRGNKSPWMKTVIVEPGTEVDPDPGMSSEFVNDAGIHYDGTMPVDEINSRLESFRAFSET